MEMIIVVLFFIRLVQPIAVAVHLPQPGQRGEDGIMESPTNRVLNALVRILQTNEAQKHVDVVVVDLDGLFALVQDGVDALDGLLLLVLQQEHDGIQAEIDTTDR